MSAVMWMVVGGVVIGVVMYLFRPSALGRAVTTTLSTGKLEPILVVIEKKPQSQQATHFNIAIKRLWDNYEREMAIRLVKEMAKRLSDTTIAQYWMRHVIEVEPGLAKKAFDQRFIQTYFKPDVAAQSGKVG